jgi:hypothetical protein
MGRGACNVEARVAASVGELESIAPDFQPALDVPNGGVLFALRALLALGLLESTPRYFELPKGYYALDSLFLLLAFMALARLKSIESLRYCAPGEWGKLLGLDRVPEVRTLRHKLHLLASDERPEQWSAELCKRWMEAAPEQAGTLYIDGHVRVYNGHQTPLPRHYVARQRLCLRATTDYWVNAMDGQPFFVVNQAVDPGLIKIIEQDILARLDEDVPGQPSEALLEADPLLHRFTVVFDREGYSPKFLERMKSQRVACLTYHKYPGDDWPEEEFSTHQVTLPGAGQVVQMKLAERGTCLSNKLWVREIRGHSVHRLPLGRSPSRRGDVRAMVTGKLLQVRPGTLQPGPSRGLSYRSDFRPHTGHQPRLSPPRCTGALMHWKTPSPPGSVRRDEPRRDD